MNFSHLIFLHFSVSISHLQIAFLGRKSQCCNRISSILVQINASSLFPSFQARFVTDENAKTMSILDLQGMGLSISQACSFVAHFSGQEEEVKRFSSAIVYSLTFVFSLTSLLFHQLSRKAQTIASSMTILLNFWHALKDTHKIRAYSTPNSGLQFDTRVPVPVFLYICCRI